MRSYAMRGAVPVLFTAHLKSCSISTSECIEPRTAHTTNVGTNNESGILISKANFLVKN
jgi:hypothetical protein